MGINLYKSEKYRKRVFFDILQVGCGGTGSWLVPDLTAVIHSFKNPSRTSYSNTYFRYTLMDGDKVEEKNTSRQKFIEKDIGLQKSHVLSRRYSGFYNKVYHIGMYVDSVQSVKDSFESLTDHFIRKSEYDFVYRIIIGCVDNHATRRVLHDYFLQDDSCIYLDAGITSVEKQDPINSGYTGQVVCGVHIDNTILRDSALIFTDILTEKESKLPTANCGTIVESQPQRIQTNMYAAAQLKVILNQIIFDKNIVTHMVLFDAKTGRCDVTPVSIQNCLEVD